MNDSLAKQRPMSPGAKGIMLVVVEFGGFWPSWLGRRGGADLIVIRQACAETAIALASRVARVVPAVARDIGNDSTPRANTRSRKRR